MAHSCRQWATISGQRRGATAIKRRRRGLALFFALAAAMILTGSFPSDGLSYSRPVEPMSPKSRSECDALHQQYLQMANSLRAAATQKRGEASRVAASANTVWDGYLAARPIYEEASRLGDEALAVGQQGVNARNRCLRLVSAYERDRQREQAQAQEAASEIATSTILDRLSDLDESGSLATFLDYKSHLDELGSGTGAFGISVWQPSLGSTTDAISRMGRWNQLHSTLVKNALDAITVVHSDVVSALEAAMRDLDAAGLGSGGGEQAFFEALPEDKLSNQLASAVNAVRGEVRQRASRAETIRRVDQQRAASERPRAPSPPRAPRPSSGARISACQQAIDNYVSTLTRGCSSGGSAAGMDRAADSISRVRRACPAPIGPRMMRANRLIPC